MPKLKPDIQRARREHILDAAERCFALAGFHRTTMQDICKQAAVSPGALYVYFANKEDLIAGICERDRAEFAERFAHLAEAPDFLKALEQLGNQYFEEEPAYKRLMCVEIGLESTRNPRVGEISSLGRCLCHAELRGPVPAPEGRRAHRTDAHHPRAGAGVHDHRRWSVLAPGDRSRFRSTVGAAGHAAGVRVAAAIRVASSATSSPLAYPRMRPSHEESCWLWPGLPLSALAAAAVKMGYVPLPKKAEVAVAKAVTALPVTVSAVAPADFIETVLVTGSLIPREEILVGPEIEGLRVLEVLVDEGERVKKGQVLARLVSDTLEAQLAQNDASLARSTAAIAQAQSSIAQAEARLSEARNAFERGKPLSNRATSPTA